MGAAAELIAECGVAQASLVKIGARAGASSALPIHRFGSKEGLILRVIERTRVRLVSAWSDAMQRSEYPEDEPSGLDMIRLGMESSLEMFQNPSPAERAHLVMWGETFPSSASNREFLAVDRETVEILMEYIEQGQVDGSIRPDVNPNAAAFLLLGLGRGVAALMLNEAELTDVGALRAAYHDWIAAVLGTSTAKAPRSSARPKRRPMERRGGTRVSGEAHGGSGEPQNGAAPGSGPGTTSDPRWPEEAI